LLAAVAASPPTMMRVALVFLVGVAVVLGMLAPSASASKHIAIGTAHATGHLVPFMALAKELKLRYPSLRVSFIVSEVGTEDLSVDRSTYLSLARAFVHSLTSISASSLAVRPWSASWVRSTFA